MIYQILEFDNFQNIWIDDEYIMKQDYFFFQIRDISNLKPLF